MKFALNLAFVVICTVLFCTYVGQQLGGQLIGIIVGFTLAISYVIYKALHENENTRKK